MRIRWHGSVGLIVGVLLAAPLLAGDPLSPLPPPPLPTPLGEDLSAPETPAPLERFSLEEPHVEGQPQVLPEPPGPAWDGPEEPFETGGHAPPGGFHGACTTCGEGSCHCENACFSPRWTITADGVVLQRSAARRRTLLVDTTGPTEAFNAGDLAFNHEAGPRVSFIRHGILGSCWDFEVNYMRVDGWQSAIEFGPGAFDLTVDASGGPAVDQASFRYISELDNLEFNLRLPFGTCLTPFAGFRWMELRDDYRADAAWGAQPYTHTINVDNHMYGFQLGTDVEFWDRGGCLRLEGFLKAAVFHCAADQNTLYAAAASTVASAGGTKTAFVGEAGLTGVCRITNHLALRGGYQVMWIEGLALAPDQIGSTNLGGVSTLDMAGSLFLHGAYGGLEVTW